MLALFSRSKVLLIRGFQSLEEGISYYLTSMVIFCLMLTMASEIFCRLALNYSILGSVEVVEVSLVIIIFASLGGIQRDRGHIRVDILINRLMKDRVGLIVESFNLLLSAAFIGFFNYACIRYTLALYDRASTTEYLHWPLWIFAMWMPIGGILLLTRLATQMKQLLSGKPVSATKSVGDRSS